MRDASKGKAIESEMNIYLADHVIVVKPIQLFGYIRKSLNSKGEDGTKKAIIIIALALRYTLEKDADQKISGVWLILIHSVISSQDVIILLPNVRGETVFSQLG